MMKAREIERGSLRRGLKRTGRPRCEGASRQSPRNSRFRDVLAVAADDRGEEAMPISDQAGARTFTG